MSTYTDYLNLFKWDPETDGEEEFDIEKALNENWDKLDVKIKQHILNTAQTILEFEAQINNDFSSYKETIDEEIEDFEKNSFATVEMVNGYVSDVYDTTQTYSVGDYCIYGNTLYKCTTAITTAEAWNSGHWTATTIATELNKRLEFEVVETW